MESEGLGLTLEAPEGRLTLLPPEHIHTVTLQLTHTNTPYSQSYPFPHSSTHALIHMPPPSPFFQGRYQI